MIIFNTRKLSFDIQKKIIEQELSTITTIGKTDDDDIFLLGDNNGNILLRSKKDDKNQMIPKNYKEKINCFFYNPTIVCSVQEDIMELTIKNPE